MRRWLLLSSEKEYRWPLSNSKPARYHKIRGKTYLVLGQVQIPTLYFYPDTPKKVVWLDPS